MRGRGFYTAEVSLRFVIEFVLNSKRRLTWLGVWGTGSGPVHHDDDDTWGGWIPWRCSFGECRSRSRFVSTHAMGAKNKWANEQSRNLKLSFVWNDNDMFNVERQREIDPFHAYHAFAMSCNSFTRKKSPTDADSFFSSVTKPALLHLAPSTIRAQTLQP